MTPDQFVAAIGPSAVASAALTHVPAGFVVAEGALESGWGTSDLATQGMNLFGVKADPAWTGPTLDMPTREYDPVKGWYMTVAKWRKYATWLGCIGDHAAFFRANSRYATCFEHTDSENFAHAVAAAGYATDPTYADKLVAIIRQHNLARLDAPTPSALPVAPPIVTEKPPMIDTTTAPASAPTAATADQMKATIDALNQGLRLLLATGAGQKAAGFLAGYMTQIVAVCGGVGGIAGAVASYAHNPSDITPIAVCGAVVWSAIKSWYMRRGMKNHAAEIKAAIVAAAAPQPTGPAA